MTPVSVPMKSNSISPILASQYQQQQYWAAVQMNSMRAYNAIPIINPSTGRSSMGFHDVLVQ
jgi:hypothetical protein